MKTAIWNAGNAFDMRYTRTFVDSPLGFDYDRYVDDNLDRLEIMKEWKRAVSAILDAKTMDEVKASSKQYEDLWKKEWKK